jgi:glycerol kinase
MERDSSQALTGLTVDGGMSQSNLCMQIQADISQRSISRPKMLETTALGAAIAAGLAVGVWSSLEELKEVNEDDRTEFRPRIGRKKSERMFGRWEKAVEMCRGWVTDEEEDEEDEEDEEGAKEGKRKNDGDDEDIAHAAKTTAEDTSLGA